jgi:hypothetical protein
MEDMSLESIALSGRHWRVWEKLNMRNRDDKNQCDRETKTRPPGHETKHTLEEFWRYQLDRVKELAESQAIKPDSCGNQ